MCPLGFNPPKRMRVGTFGWTTCSDHQWDVFVGAGRDERSSRDRGRADVGPPAASGGLEDLCGPVA